MKMIQINLVQCVILKRSTFVIYSQNQIKEPKNVAIFSTCRPLYGKTIDDGKKKQQILTYYDFSKGRTHMVD